MGDRRAFERRAPSPSRDVLPVRASHLIALGVLHERSVDEIRSAPARRRRPSESVGGSKTNLALARPRGNRSLSQRHEAGRCIGRLRRSTGFTDAGSSLIDMGDQFANSQPIGSSGRSKEHGGTPGSAL